MLDYVGVDGEGVGRKPHNYVLLAVSDDSGRFQRHIEGERLVTVECLDFLLSLAKHTRRLFGFALNYDITMMLRDCPDEFLYYLMRPDLRVKDENKGPEPISWGDYEMNITGSMFRLSKNHGDFAGESITLWDTWKFYQAKFVKALQDWKIANQEVWDRIANMKNMRNVFTQEMLPEMRGYCLDECMYMAQLTRRLVEAHKEVGLELRDFHGAGSTAKVILKKMGIKHKRREPPPEFMPYIMRAFFGGRFECSVAGRLPGKIYNYDISSAYPYHITRLPCLEHGNWSMTTDIDRVRGAKAACVLWHNGTRPEWEHSVPESVPWGPFPFRTEKGTILFPVAGGMGWCWKDEFFSALNVFPHMKITMITAIVLESNCDCQPFKDVPTYYIERVKLGKDNKGKILKFGPNALYGKLAQSVGNPEFNSWVWAGIITSNTRGQLLRAMGAHRDMRNLLWVATDGIYTREKLLLERPYDTGTYHVISDGKYKPLGGWEEDWTDDGMFCARPGVYFPLNVDEIDSTLEGDAKAKALAEKMAEIRARGFGRKAIYDNAKLIMHHWDHFRDSDKVMLPNIPRFYGAKSSISRSGIEGEYRYTRKEEYGDWFEYEPFMSFNPLPKRRTIRDNNTLEPHVLPAGVMSAPYKKLEGDDNMLAAFEDILNEQLD